MKMLHQLSVFDARSEDSGLDCGTVSMTKQSFAEECDINTIVKRFRLTGEMPTDVRMPEFGDYKDVKDFHTAMNAVALANEAFDAMPAEVRAKFQNDPAKFVDFCLDDANYEEAKKLGLVKVQQSAAALAGVPGAAAVAAVAGPSAEPPKAAGA